MPSDTARFQLANPEEPVGREEAVLADTRAWLERAVIGLNLCPFARAVHVKGLIHFFVSPALTAAQVLDDLRREAADLQACPPHRRETTLLVVPDCLEQFLEFNDVVARAERMLRKDGLEGVLQLASFHPAYCFADAVEDDMTNSSNRSPYPTLHLLREASVERAVLAFPDAESIYGRNRETLRALGAAGWAALGLVRHR
jgi:hypothetical protein